MTTRTLAAEQARPLAARLDGGAIGAWTLGFATVAYLGLKGGGYDVVVRSQAGIGVWWIVLIGAALGVLPQRRVGRAGLAALGLLAAFAAWSALSALWSESPERTISETARVVTLLGVAVLALSTVRAQRVRPLVNGIFAAIVGVGVLACLSRLHPAWFGEPQTAKFLPARSARLSYGLNYWNALAAFMAMGVPLGLAIAMSARTAAARSAALAAVPVLVLTGFFTISRGGILARRRRTARRPRDHARPRALARKAGPGRRGRGDPRQGRPAARRAARRRAARPLAHRQGDELLVIVLVVVAGIVLVHVGASLARGRPARRPRCRRCAPSSAAWRGARSSSRCWPAPATFAASGSLADRWQEFKAPPGARPATTSTASPPSAARAATSSGSAPCDAFETRPVVGIGAGSFENWWEPHATRRESVRNAHSLYAETLGELGLVGITLLLALIALIIVAGVARRPPPDRDRRPRSWPAPPPPAPPSPSRPASTGSGR